MLPNSYPARNERTRRPIGGGRAATEEVPHIGYLFHDSRTGACARLGPGAGPVARQQDGFHDLTGRAVGKAARTLSD